MRRASLLSTIAITTAFTIGAGAYSIYAKWPSGSAGVYINPKNADVSDNAAITAILYGAEVWEKQSSALFDFFYKGQVSDTTTSYDNRNVVIFRNQSNGSTIATTYSWYSGSTLLDADIVLWDAGFKFFTGSSGCSGGIYIEDIAAHEFGHALGLKHSSVSGATMWPTTSYCSQNWRTLAPDDIAGIGSLYPGGDPNTAPNVSISKPTSGTSVLKGTTIAFTGTASDSQDGSLTSLLKWTSSKDGQIGTGGSFSKVLSVGSHVISATATDSGGLQDSSQVTVTVTESSLTPTLTAVVSKVRGKTFVNLTWTGISSSSVKVYRNNSLLLTTANDGSYSDPVAAGGGSRNGGSYVYRICASGTSICSNNVTVSF